jgi:hypothetical protein
MKQLIIGGAIITVLAVIVSSGLFQPDAKWSGVDDAVVNHFAEKAGRPAQEAYINVGRGDMQLFFFLLAGALGGFVAGYHYRELFASRKSDAGGSLDV